MVITTISSREIKRKIKYHAQAGARYKDMKTMGPKRRIEEVFNKKEIFGFTYFEKV
jgi:hypothetical protein